VKANAYGHGLIACARQLAPHVEWFGVSALEEALQLRQAGISHPILLFGHLAMDEVKDALEWNLTLSVSDLDYGIALDRQLAKSAKRLQVHVKLDSGMGRFGFSAQTAARDILNLARSEWLDLNGLYTHFPQAEKLEDPFTLKQIEEFKAFEHALSKQGLEFQWVHAVGSSGLINYPQAQGNLVRPGLALYGLYPDEGLREKIELRPALSFKAKWVMVKKIKKGESVGYGRTFIAQSDTVIGILPVGYSHGYPFGLHNKAKIMLHGRIYPVVGKISMDYIAVDLGADSPVAIGDPAIVIGEDQNCFIRAEAMAKAAATIPYDIVSRLSPVIERVFIN